MTQITHYGGGRYAGSGELLRLYADHLKRLGYRVLTPTKETDMTVVNLPPEGLFGVPKELIPADLYDMLVRAKTRDWQTPPPALPPDQRRRYWVVDRLMEIRGYSREIAENYYDRVIRDWMEA